MSAITDVSQTWLREHLAETLRACSHRGERFRVVRNGKPEAVLISASEWDSMVETLAVLSDPKLMNQIRGSGDDVKFGRFRDADDIFRDMHNN